MPSERKDDELNHVHHKTSADRNDDRPAETFPAFDDPAFSARPAGSPVEPTAPTYKDPPRDTEYAGHPGFSEDAALDVAPHGIGNSETTRRPRDGGSRRSRAMGKKAKANL